MVKRTLHNEIEEVFVRLAGRPPTAEEQAELLSDALRAIMTKNPVMRIDKLDERFVKITGAEGIDKTLSGHMGRAGEVIIYDSVREFVSSPRMEEKWGGTAIGITADVLIPIDIRSREALERSALSQIQKQSVEKARNSWVSNVDENSIADFLMTNAYPLEAKTRWESKVYVSESGTKKVDRQDKRMYAKNAYIKKIAKQGGKTVVGAMAFDVVFESLFEKQKKEIKKGLEKVAKGLTKHHNQHVTFQVEGTNVEFFKMVSLRINAFVPAVVDDKNFEQWILGQVIDPTDRRVNMVVSEFTTEIMDGIKDSMKNRRR